MAVPVKDSLLLNWATNARTRGSAEPERFGLSAEQMAAFGVVYAAFVSAYNAANVPGARSKSLVVAKDAAKALLLASAREVYGMVQACASVSAADKELFGVRVHRRPSPHPVPAHPPALDVLWVNGKTVGLRLHDAVHPSRRGKPVQVAGASVFSFIGAEPPADPAGWKFEGNTTRATFEATFPDSVAPGTQVWLTAAWFNQRVQPGPRCAPVSTHLQFGAMAA
jgi:hypothetical protein